MAALKLPPSKGEPQNLKAKSNSNFFRWIGAFFNPPYE
ncbi:hypothetical protein AM1_H0024 (plasmid) [Acaryochloris marina MBIC11017]|uniref:Uncharacterized protein n=1 Tax=Acaryochloris marina (strain MBIC 11017) TaxID=329726 RepID=A8ZQU1_ACAM1|nr:hypothetical protein AM1_H0024 [Acaryochloris marina MBIC11017]